MNRKLFDRIPLISSAASLCLGKLFLACATLLPAPAMAADYDDEPKLWEFKSGLDRESFKKVFSELAEKDFRISDIETYRMGRSSSVTTLWTKLGADERWTIEMSLPVGDFIKAHEKNLEKGFSLVEFEIVRNGATLHFSGIWVSSPNHPIESEFFLGMESMEFSNRYGEMADRGYRLIDFEPYESNGKDRQAALWLKNDEEVVRFYRAIPKQKFGEVVESMRANGFRVHDVEGYEYEGKFVFAAEWVKLKEGQEAQFAYNLLADEFYNKNAQYTGDGYRLTEFETYEEDGVVHYAGSWLKSPKNAKVIKETKEEKKTTMSLEAFRSSE